MTLMMRRLIAAAAIVTAIAGPAAGSTILYRTDAELVALVELELGRAAERLARGDRVRGPHEYAASTNGTTPAPTGTSAEVPTATPARSSSPRPA